MEQLHAMFSLRVQDLCVYRLGEKHREENKSSFPAVQWPINNNNKSSQIRQLLACRILLNLGRIRTSYP